METFNRFVKSRGGCGLGLLLCALYLMLLSHAWAQAPNAVGAEEALAGDQPSTLQLEPAAAEDHGVDTNAALDRNPPSPAVSPSSAPGRAKHSATNDGRLVSIDFNNVDIVVFIKFISDLTKKNFIIDDRVKARVSIVSPGKISAAEAYRVFESVLDVHGFAAVPAGDIIKIVPGPEARTKSIKTRLQEEAGPGNDTVVTQIIPMRYADTEEIKRLFTPLVSKNAVILSYAPTNTLIITDVQSNINRLLRILKAIDVTGVGQQIALIPVENADASKLVNLLTTIFKAPQRGGRPAPEKDITFVADERTNIIVVMASEGDTENIRQLVKNLDKETPRGQGKIHVYYLEHAAAEDLAKVLQEIPQQKSNSTPVEGKAAAPVFSERARITADKATNSLIIMAEMEEYITIEEIIRKIDIPRAMVYIEALIMEVNVNKDFRLGTEWLGGATTSYKDKDMIYGGGFGGGAIGGDPGYSHVGTTTIGSGAAAATIKALPPGFSLGIFGEALEISGIKFPSIGAIVQAYKKDRDARILSTPQILTTDNQEAKIYVGRNVPFQTTATATATGNEVYNSFEYRDVGKTLKITPMISKDRMVRLNLALEVTELESTSEFRPTTLKRTVETTAIVKDQQTIVLGGLIDDTSSKTDYRVPCLGDVPGFGMLFRSQATGAAKTNLYVFLTPRVIQNPDEALGISKNKREQIDTLRAKDIKLYKNRPAVTPEASQPPPRQPAVESYNYYEEKEQVESEPLQELSTNDANTPAALNPPTPVVTPPPIAEGDLVPQLQVPLSGPVMLESASAAAAAVSQTTSPSVNRHGGFTIQVSSLKTAAAANQLLRQLTAQGYAAYTVRAENAGEVWYRLRVGYFDQRQAAEEIMQKLRVDHYDPLLIKI